MLEEQDTTQCFRKVSWLFTGKRFKDSSWSWIVCVSAAVCHAVNLGMVLSFGVLFPTLMDYFDETRERTAFVGSIGLGMVWFASPLAGYLCDRFGWRITCFLGGTLCIAGLVSTSFVQSFTVMYFTYSALYGLGTCFICNSCFLAIAKYFTDKLSVATGIVSLGAGVGVLYTGPLLQVLLDSFEWRNTFRIMAATYVLVCILSLSFNPYVEEIATVENLSIERNNKDEERDDKSGISLYCSVWSFPAYTVIVTSFTIANFGMYIPYINLVKYCEDIRISAQKASRLFIFIGLASCVARLMTGRLCNNKRVNPVYVYQSCLVTAGLAAFMLPFTTKYWSLIVFSVIYGLSDGIYITTQNFILLTVVDSKRTTASFCINNVLYSFSAAAGGPVAGEFIISLQTERENCPGGAQA
ncbi:monocarboxylate transporter 10-like [Orbicella faveolata]|uniref:monocarboxylate transporter 10-like n=1 Tax=Orbicella faveolata TaxID=48498 RepID=UPI0009E2BFB0|nr:monocarboxylate transporter 10-like [Orbicella faveolata]